MQRGRWVWLGVLVAGAVLGAGCGEGAGVVDDPREEWLEPETGRPVVDGDVLANPNGDGELATTVGSLTVATVAGHDDVWPTTQRQALTYCIDRVSFGDAFEAVRRAMASATTDWSEAANVKFVHLPEEDARCNARNGKVLFDVRRVTERPYLARSFFPSEARPSRELLIDQTSLPAPAPLTLIGVLRHELGHVLGLRHEHTRQKSNPCYEDAQWRALTPYDVRSVMHYPQCKGVTDRDLTLSARDRKGIGVLYP